MKISILDSDSYGPDIDLSGFLKLGSTEFFSHTNENEILNRIRFADIAVINNIKIDNSTIRRTENLRLIAIAATGTDNVDTEFCRASGIEVVNVSGYAVHSVAQHTFAMLFELIENNRSYDSFIKSGNWSKTESPWEIKVIYPQIHGKRWGILGMGNIGRRVAEIAAAFGCEVAAYKDKEHRLPDSYEGYSLEEIMKTSDIISIHLPYSTSTNGLVSGKMLGLMKKGSVLLNLGRGGIVDETALARLIDEDKIMAGLDVFSEEPLSIHSPLLKVRNRDNLLMTPHTAFSSREARQAVIDGTILNIRKFLKTADI